MEKEDDIKLLREYMNGAPEAVHQAFGRVIRLLGEGDMVLVPKRATREMYYAAAEKTYYVFSDEGSTQHKVDYNITPQVWDVMVETFLHPYETPDDEKPTWQRKGYVNRP